MDLSILNAAQREAVTTTEGFVRVIAGAGSGKTRALSHRFAYLVNDMGILPGNILCVTFTNKAANEMRQRIHNLTGDNDTGYINTFHGFCVTVLQEDSYAVQYPRSFLVLDNSDIDAMLQIIYEERGLSLRDKTFAQARDMIEIQKGIKRPDYYLDLIGMSLAELREKYENATAVDDIIFYGYLYQEKKCFGLDYNDLIFVTLYIFEQNEEIRLKWQQRLEYIMIDEFQDIDPPQYRLMEALCGYHKNLFIVGDPDQTIYTWRGADVRFLLEFDRKHPGTKTIMMMENYRSTPQILAAASSLIDKNRTRIKKDLIPTLPAGPLPLCHHAPNAELEAAQNDLAPRVDAAEAACGEEDGYLWVGTALSGSYYGITWAYNGEDEVMLWGTLTSANRRLLCLNGQNAIKGTSGTFEKTLEKGAYTLEADARGYAAESAGSFKWVYSYDTFATEQTAITISDFHAQIVLDAPAMLGFLVTGGVDFGTEDSPTILTLRASRKTAVDTVARKAAAGLPKAKPIDTFVDGGYITLNGTTADIYNPTSSTNYRYAVVPCEGGDLFTISGSGGTAPRLWGFIDGSGTVLAISDYDLTAEDVVVENVHLSESLMQLSYRMTHKNKNKDREKD